MDRFSQSVGEAETDAEHRGRSFDGTRMEEHYRSVFWSALAATMAQQWLARWRHYSDKAREAAQATLEGHQENSQTSITAALDTIATLDRIEALLRAQLNNEPAEPYQEDEIPPFLVLIQEQANWFAQKILNTERAILERLYVI